MVFGHHTQVAVEMVIPQDVREAIVLVRKVEEVAEVGAISFMGLPEAMVTGQQGDGRVAVGVKCGAVVRAEAWKVPERCLRVLSIVEMGCVRRALSGKHCDKASGRNTRTLPLLSSHSSRLSR